MKIDTYSGDKIGGDSFHLFRSLIKVWANLLVTCNANTAHLIQLKFSFWLLSSSKTSSNVDWKENCNSSAWVKKLRVYIVISKGCGLKFYRHFLQLYLQIARVIPFLRDTAIAVYFFLCRNHSCSKKILSRTNTCFRSFV